MAKPSPQEDTLSHPPPRAKTGRSVAGPLCEFRRLSGRDACGLAAASPPTSCFLTSRRRWPAVCCTLLPAVRPNSTLAMASRQMARRPPTGRLFDAGSVTERGGHDGVLANDYPAGNRQGHAPGFAPIAIGFALTLIHLISIPVTNTSMTTSATGDLTRATALPCCAPRRKSPGIVYA